MYEGGYIVMQKDNSDTIHEGTIVQVEDKLPTVQEQLLFEMVSNGATYQSVGNQFGMSASGVYHAVRRVRRVIEDYTPHDMLLERMEVLRGLRHRAYTLATQDAPPMFYKDEVLRDDDGNIVQDFRLQLDAMRLMLAIETRIAKLWGLDGRTHGPLCKASGCPVHGTDPGEGGTDPAGPLTGAYGAHRPLNAWTVLDDEVSRSADMVSRWDQKLSEVTCDADVLPGGAYHWVYLERNKAREWMARVAMMAIQAGLGERQAQQAEVNASAVSALLLQAMHTANLDASQRVLLRGALRDVLLSAEDSGSVHLSETTILGRST